MPRILIPAVLFIVLLIPLSPAGAAPALALDGQLLAFQEEPVILEQKVMVPIRPILQEMGWRLACDMEEGVVYAERSANKIQIFLWQPAVVKNDVEISLTAVPQLISGHTMMSLEDICRLTGAQGTWDAQLELASFFSPVEMTREGVVRSLLAADRQLMRVEYYNNQDFLKHCSIAPSPKINSKEELINFLGSYWSPEYIERIWQAGSRENVFIGFFRDGVTPLDYQKEISVVELAGTQARIEAKLPVWWGGEGDAEQFVNRVYTLIKDPEGKLLIKDIQIEE